MAVGDENGTVSLLEVSALAPSTCVRACKVHVMCSISDRAPRIGNIGGKLILRTPLKDLKYEKSKK